MPDDPSHRRGLQGHRQYAPWFFADAAMLRDKDSKLHLLPIETKEALHHFDRDYSSCPKVSEKDRHRLLGNSWHMGVATEMMRFSLLFGVRPLPGPYAPDASDVSGVRDLESAQQLAGRHPLSMQRKAETSVHIDMQPAVDMWDHWHLSAEAVHPLHQRLTLEPAIELTLQQRLLKFKPERLAEFRRQVLCDIKRRKQEMTSHTQEWFASLEPHVQQAYTLPDGGIVQIPLFLELLRGCAYPDIDALAEALSRGFPVLGRIEPSSPGWRPRLDDRYDHPITQSAFDSLNKQHVIEKLRKGRVDAEWEALLNEILQEVALGRMSGPYAAPSDWPRQCVPVASHQDFSVCLPAQEDAKVAAAFSVVQQGSDGSRKVRRCEDYRRSGHNATVHVSDVPAHDDTDKCVQILLRLNAAGHSSELWCQDLQVAYRQLPVQETSHAVALLLTPSGPTLWRHDVLPFGAASSVWCFNRCVDALTYLARSLLLILVIHFVDDIGCPDARHSAASRFASFTELCELLGMRLKPSTAQVPAVRHKLLGVFLEVCLEGVSLAPATDRIQKVLQVIQQALQDDCLEPVVAQRLTGKLNFISTTLFGQAAAAAMKPLYSRAHDCNSQTASQLNQPLRCALRSLQTLLRSPSPRWVPFEPATQSSAVLYADAFFELGDKAFGLSDEPPENWYSTSFRRYRNGWGFVVRCHSVICFAHGSVPNDVLALFTPRRAYIYCLEIFGQILAALTCRDILPKVWVGFCDNMAGRSALVRGYGRDATINNLLACFWAVARLLEWQPHFEWVASDLNIADPFSRGDCSIGGSRHWHELASPMDALWPIFKRVATDLEYALEVAPKALLQLEWRFLPGGGFASTLDGQGAETRRQ